MAKLYFISAFILLIIRPVAAQQPELILPKGHSKSVEKLMFSGSGQYLLSQNRDELKIWDFKRGIQLYTISSINGSIQTAVLSPDSEFIVAGGEDGGLRIWRLVNGQLVETLNPFFGEVYSLTFYEPRKLCVAFYGGRRNDRSIITIAKYDLDKKQIIDQISREYRDFDTMSSFAVSKDANTCLLSLDQRYYKLQFSSNSWEEMETHDGMVGVGSTTFSPDGKRAITGPSCMEWDLAQKKVIKDYIGEGALKQTAFINDDAFITVHSHYQKKGGIVRLVDKAHRAPEAPEYNAFKKQLYFHEPLTAVAVSPDQKYVVAASNTIYAWSIDFLEGEPIKTFQGESIKTFQDEPIKTFRGISTSISSLAIAPFGQKALISISANAIQGTAAEYTIASREMGQIAEIDLVSCQPTRVKSGSEGKIYSIAHSPDGNYFSFGSRSGKLSVWRSDSLLPKKEYTFQDAVLSPNAFSPNNREFFSVRNGGPVFGFDLASDKRMQLTSEGLVWALDFFNTQKLLMAGSTIEIADWSSGFIKHKSYGEVPGSITGIKAIGNDSILYADSDGMLVLAKLGENLSNCIVHKVSPSKFNFDLSNSRQFVAVGTSDSDNYQNSVYLSKFPDFRNPALLATQSQPFTDIKFSADSRFVYAVDKDGLFKVWNTKTRKHLVTMFVLDSLNWITFTPDNYYMATRKAASFINFQSGGKIYNFNEFDLRFNRPDIVLERIGLASPDFIAYYRGAYSKRLEKLGIKEEELTTDFHQPEINILANKLSPSTTQPSLKFSVEAFDSKYKLNRLNVYINDIPIWGVNGRVIEDSASSKIKKQIEVALSPGSNKIEVSVINKNGVESKRDGLEVYYQAPARKSSLYIIAIGVSNYQDNSKALKYANKDANDFIEQFKSKSSNYAQIVSISIPENQITRSAILKLKDRLLQTEVDDKVFILLSGHGLLDPVDKRWYYATHDINFSKPAENGLAYDEIESLLDGIPARNKLLLLDACHSGELDTSPVTGPAIAVARRGSAGKGPIAATASSSKSRFTQSIEMMNTLFADLRRNTGATIISAASGTSKAYENDQLQNGYFTYAILDGLKTGQADQNRDGKIVVSELRNYVYRRVQALSNGLQVPSNRQENLTLDFTIW